MCACVEVIPSRQFFAVSESVNGNDTERDVWVTLPSPGMIGLVTRPVLSSLAPMHVYIHTQNCEIYKYPNTVAVHSEGNFLKRLFPRNAVRLLC